jgi:DNA ligase 1
MSKEICMLAHKWEDYGHRLRFPLIGQPKIDGVRLLAGTECLSRNAKPLFVPEALSRELECLRQTFPQPLDGELYSPGRNFNEISGVVRRLSARNEESWPIEYWVFDLVNPVVPDKVRQQWLDLEELNTRFSRIKRVACVELPCASALEQYFRETVAAGFEGIMLRDPEAFYECKRSPSLLKRKPWIRAWGIVLGAYEGKRALEGSLGGFRVWSDGESVCDIRGTLPKTSPWECNAGGGKGLTHSLRRKVWLERDVWVGRRVLIKFQERNPTGVPRFPQLVAEEL